MKIPRDLTPVSVSKPPYDAARTPVEVTVNVPSPGRVLYTVCVAQETYRHFDETNVPSEITSRLGMIHAFPENERRIAGLNVNGWAVHYIAPDPRLEDIGWQIYDNVYMLVLPKIFLKQLIGARNGADT